MKRILYLMLFFAFCFIGNEEVQAQVIADGTYKIQSALKNDKVLDVDNGGSTSGDNVQLWSGNDTNAQKWKIKHLGNDYYTLESAVSNNLVLDTAGGGITSGTNVQLWNNNGTDAQKWLIKAAGNGYYNIISKNSGLYIDTQGGEYADGTNVQIWKGNNSQAQKFKFVEVFDVTTSPVLDDGTYTISSFLNNSKVLNMGNTNFLAGTPIQLYDFNKGVGQFWNVTNLGDGYYKITSYWEPQKTLDIKEGYAASGTPIQLWNDNNSDAQQWIIKDAGNGYFNIVSKKNHLYLDLAGGSIVNNTKIQLWNNNGSNAQKFKFNKINGLNKLEDGYYTINSLLDSSKVLSVDSNVTYKQANVVLKNNNQLTSDKWYIEHISGVYYVIKSAANRRLVLDVAGGNSIAGANIQLWTNNNSAAQTWIMQDNLDGTYTIVSKLGKAVDVKGGIATNGTNIQLWNNNGSNAQKWTVTKTTFDNTTPLYEDGYYTINSILNEKMLLDVKTALKVNGTNVQLWGGNNSVAQIWKLEHLSDNYYTITSAMNPRISLDVAGGSSVSGTNVQIHRANNTQAQQWQLKTDENGYVTFLARNSGLALDISGGNAYAGANIQVWNDNGSNAQKFDLKPYTGKKAYKGIDISKYQREDNNGNLKNMNWETISQSSDIGFMILHAGFGDNNYDQDDKFFKEFVANCEKYNIPYGIYLYSYAKNIDGSYYSAVSEAEHTLRLIHEIEKSGYSPNLGTKVFLDIENEKWQGNLGKDKLTGIADKFCSTVQSAGYTCGIYSNINFLTNKMHAQELAKKYPIWLSWYFSQPHPTFGDAFNREHEIPYNLTSYKYWQFASDGIIPGIIGNVDLNIGYDIFE